MRPPRSPPAHRPRQPLPRHPNRSIPAPARPSAPCPPPASLFSVSKGASQNLKPAVPTGGRAHYSRGALPQPKTWGLGVSPGPAGAVAGSGLGGGALLVNQEAGWVWGAGAALALCGHSQRPPKTPSWFPAAPADIPCLPARTHLVRPGICPAPQFPESSDLILPRCLLRGGPAAPHPPLSHDATNPLLGGPPTPGRLCSGKSSKLTAAPCQVKCPACGLGLGGGAGLPHAALLTLFVAFFLCIAP